MAKQRYYLDSRVLTAFFFAAMPFVAFGSFIVVNQARTQLRESAGASLEQRAVQTKLALEQYLGEQVVHLRVLALDPEVQKALADTRPLPPEAEARAMEQAWASGKDPKLNASLLDGPLVALLEPLKTARPAVKGLQLIDSTGRLRAATTRGGRLFFGEVEWFKAFGTQLSEAEVYVGEMFRPTGTTLNLLEIAFPVRNSEDVWLGAVRMLMDAGDLYTVLAPVRIGRTGHASLLRSTDGLILASDESERILKMPLPGFDSLRNAVEGFPMAQSGQEIFGRARLHRGYWSMPEVKAKDEAGRDVVVEPARLDRLLAHRPGPQRQLAGHRRAGPVRGARPDQQRDPLPLVPLHRRLRHGDPARALLLVQARAAGDGGGPPPARGARPGRDEEADEE